MDEPEPELEEVPGSRVLECEDTPTGQVGFAALVIDKSAAEDEESLLYHYQNDALQWDASRLKGQLEALTAVAKDVVGQEATVANLRLKTATGGEDTVKAAFHRLQKGSFDAAVVFIFQVNRTRSLIARASLDVLTSMQVLGEDEARDIMPSDIVPRPLAGRDEDLFEKIAADDSKNLNLKLDAELQKFAASALDELYRTPMQAADEDGRSKTRLVLEDHEPLSKNAEEPETKPNNPYELARGLHWSNSSVQPDKNLYGEVNPEGCDDIRGRRLRAMRLPPDAVLLKMIQVTLEAIAFEVGDVAALFAKRSEQVHTDGWVRPNAGMNDQWAQDFAGGGLVTKVLDELVAQYFGEALRTAPACSPSFLPEATVFFACPAEVRARISTELTRLETASRERAREIALDARTTYVMCACYFHKGLLMETHCPSGLTRVIAGYCRREGWLTRKPTDPERVRDPADAATSPPVFVEEKSGAYVRRDLVIVAMRQEVVCLIVARRDANQIVNGEFEPFYLNSIRESIAMLTKDVVSQLDKAISAKQPLTLMDGRNNDGVFTNRKMREGLVPRVPDTTTPTLTQGVQNVLLFMVNFDHWSGCVIMRPGPETYPTGSWKDELRREFYSACNTIRGTLHEMRGVGLRVHAAAVKKKKLKKTTSSTSWPLNHYKLAEDPVKGDFPAKKGAGDAPSAGANSFSFNPNGHKMLARVCEFGMKITLSGAGAKRWSDDGRSLDRLDHSASSVASFPPEQGNRVYRDEFPPAARSARATPPKVAAPRTYPNARPGLDDAWPLSFWVVGYLLPPSDPSELHATEREFFICYQEDIPQNVAELAYKVNFGLLAK